eukprot:scaffold163747_cov17-Prasinocladus_malaysianus.AAC.1
MTKLHEGQSYPNVEVNCAMSTRFVVELLFNSKHPKLETSEPAAQLKMAPACLRGKIAIYRQC